MEHIISDIKAYYLENYETTLNDTQVKNMPICEQLRCYLEWNGIIGFDNDIMTIAKGELKK